MSLDVNSQVRGWIKFVCVWFRTSTPSPAFFLNFSIASRDYCDWIACAGFNCGKWRWWRGDDEKSGFESLSRLRKLIGDLEYIMIEAWPLPHYRSVFARYFWRTAFQFFLFLFFSFAFVITIRSNGFLWFLKRINLGVREASVVYILHEIT